MHETPVTKLPPRSAERIREHYLIEKSLAERLRNASRAERRLLYRDLYDELFRRVPDHSQLQKKAGIDVRIRSWRELRLLRKLVPPGAVFMELGAGDCKIALEVAQWAGAVRAVDVSTEIVRNVELPANFKLVLSDGCSVPVDPDSVDVAYSNQLIEHLHPDDVHEQMKAVYAALRPGGRVICLTPHRFTGPHDISRGFDDVATGFHLHEYTSAELFELLRRCGFTKVRQLVGARGRYVEISPALVAVIERFVGKLPPRRRRAICSLPGFRMALDRLMFTARKPG